MAGRAAAGVGVMVEWCRSGAARWRSSMGAGFAERAARLVCAVVSPGPPFPAAAPSRAPHALVQWRHGEPTTRVRTRLVGLQQGESPTAVPLQCA